MRLSIREKLENVSITTGTIMMPVSHDLEETVSLADAMLLPTKGPMKVAALAATKAWSMEVFRRGVRR